MYFIGAPEKTTTERFALLGQKRKEILYGICYVIAWRNSIFHKAGFVSYIGF